LRRPADRQGDSDVLNGRVHVRHHEVPIEALPAQADGFRIAHLSDLHLRSIDRTAREARRMLCELRPDVTVCTGDLGDHPDEYEVTASLCRQFFEPVAEFSPCFAVLGNHDSVHLAQQANLPVRFLLDEAVQVAEGRMAIAGVSQTWDGPGDIERALHRVASDRPTILLAHYPSTVYRVRDGRVRLVLAGHTHGGQIRLPLLGCVYAQDAIPLRMARGLHVVNGRTLNVSAGLGVSWPMRLRFLCPPEISLLTLRSAARARPAGRPKAYECEVAA
jgi:predicted MPP superfamily phosphohydrolase